MSGTNGGRSAGLEHGLTFAPRLPSYTVGPLNDDFSVLEEKQALDGFPAPVPEAQVRIVRLIVGAEADGAITEAIASALRISFHLCHLEDSGLVRSCRDGCFTVNSAVFLPCPTSSPHDA